MKKLASALGATILLLTAVPAGATSEPGGDAALSQMAFANWIVRDHGQTWLYFGAGMNTTASTDPTMGFVGRALCNEVERDGRTFLRCRGRSRGRALSPGEFVIDPTLNAATLSMEAQGESHTIQWEGRGDQPEPYVHQHAGLDIGVLAMTMMWRRANTAGQLFGLDLSSKRGVMFEDVYATAWTGTMQTVDGTRFRFEDGVLKVSKLVY